MSTLSTLRGVILDLDGTLIDTLGDFEVALHRCLVDMGAQPQKADRTFISLTVGKGSEYLVRQTLAHVGLDADDASVYENAYARYQHHYGQINGQYSEVFPGVAEGLKMLSERQLPLACLTNKPGPYARALLRHVGLDHHFQRILGGDEFARKKPDPLPLLQTCAAIGLPTQDVLMVGDSSNDAQAGHAAGCPVALVSYGYNHGRPIHEVPALIYVDRLDELAPHLPPLR